MQVFIVMPDLSLVKVKALTVVSKELGPIPILVSYPILLTKKHMVERLRTLIRKDVVSMVMLDSGGYYLRDYSFDKLAEYTQNYVSFILRYSKLFNFIVVPDVPGQPKLTIQLSRLFYNMAIEGKILDDLKGKLVVVLQGRTYEDYIKHYRELQKNEHELYIKSFLIGIGGLDGSKRRIKFICNLVRSIDHPRIHIFGGTVRLIKGLVKRRLHKKVFSTDTSTWLHEIKYRRKNYGIDTVSANINAIKSYLVKVNEVLNSA